MEQRLAGLLNKKSCIRTKRACTGKYRGKYDYGLLFEDGSSLFISLGWSLYEKRLQEKIEYYQYFRDNHAWLTEQVQKVIERDNRQAAVLGLAPITFIRLELIEEKADSYAFWVRAVLEQNGVRFDKLETNFYYACLGFETEEYFEKKINRPNEKLSVAHHSEPTNPTAIIFGYLYEPRDYLPAYLLADNKKG